MAKFTTLAKSIVAGAGRVTLLVIVFAICTPVFYFAWRAGQPMALPELGGSTYFEWLQHRAGAYDEMALDYQTRNPGRQVKNGICFYTEAGVQALAGFPTAGMYALAGMYPALNAGVDPRDLRDGLVPDVAGWLEFLPAWWETYEKIVWQMAQHATDGPVPYCRIASS